MTAAATGLVGIAFDGFNQARVRLTRTIEETTNLYTVTVPTMETAYWARALDEQLVKADLAYRAARQQPEGTVIRGLQWLRNRTTHALPLTLRAVGGLSAPITVPITLQPLSIIWHHADQLPPEEPNHTSPAGRSAYNTAFAHKPLLGPLDDVAQWFAAERSRAGSALTEM
ncbi:hypothetical protein ACFVXG_38085 [Kitasatospora sp. NPDC058162]|uniref:hypothetical protein n=1 Tax=Kitasatospora sp. NPDC058162 TaxID=3346362 RepID=UPI0036DC380D